MGEGLIFLSDTLQPLEVASAFRQMDLDGYTQWKEEREKDVRPLRPCEPVAFFQFDHSTQLTLSIEQSRPAKYVMLLPTGFRKFPDKLCQNPNFVPMEIQFFGAIGQTISDSNPLECMEIIDRQMNMQQEIGAEFSCEVRLLTAGSSCSFASDSGKVDDN